MHSDIEKYLLETGSLQEDIWGINLYPDNTKDCFVEFDSMINLRPQMGNFSRGVDDVKIQKLIKDLVYSKVILDE